MNVRLLPLFSNYSKIMISQLSGLDDRKTMVWYPKKQKIDNGLKLPSSFQDAYLHELCTVSLNRSHLMLIHSQSVFKVAVFIIDFMQEKWIPLSMLAFHLIHLYNCKGASGFDKNDNQYV